MEQVAVSKAAHAATSQPNNSTNHKNKSDHGIKRQRLRQDGKAVTKEEIKKKIIDLLTAKPRGPTELAAALNFSRVWAWNYCKELLEEGKIEKQGQVYKITGTTEIIVNKQRFDDIVKRSDFLSLPILTDYINHIRELKGLNSSTYLSKLWGVCIGKKVPTFKCRPEAWTPDATIAFVKAWKEYTGKDRLNSDLRQLIRYIHEYILHKPITDAEKALWGVDGKKDKIGTYAHVRLTESQIIALSKYFLDKGDLELAGYTAGGIECFGRPNALFDAQIANFQLTERTITKATITGWPEPVYDSKFMPILQALSMRDNNIKIETFKAPAIEGQLYEGKTEDIWPKRILGAHAVKIMTEVLHERRNKPTLYNWSGKNWQAWGDYLTPKLKEAYQHIGATHAYFVKRPMYVIRHVGAQMWLGRTMYDYAGVAEMGWRDIATLHRWYGGYSMEFFNQKVAVQYA